VNLYFSSSGCIAYACVCDVQTSPKLVINSGTYDVTADAECPHTARSQLHLSVTLASQKAYFILVSGQPPRPELVSDLFTAVESGRNTKDLDSALYVKLLIMPIKLRNLSVYVIHICIMCPLSK